VESIPELVVAQAGKEPGDPDKGMYIRSSDSRFPNNDLAVAQRVIEAVDGTGITGAAIARLDLPMG
jgi:hypothetical protein